MALGAQAGHEAQPSKVPPASLPSRRRIALTAPIRRAAGVISSHRTAACSLWGTVTTSPPRLCKPRRPANSAGRPSGET